MITTRVDNRGYLQESLTGPKTNISTNCTKYNTNYPPSGNQTRNHRYLASLRTTPEWLAFLK